MNVLHYIKGPYVCLLLLALAALPVSAASLTVTGTVADISGNPIAGATVIIKSGSDIITGTASDNDGDFSLEVGRSALYSPILEISSIGYFGITMDINLTRDTIIVPVFLEKDPVRLRSLSVSPRYDRSATSVSLSKIRVENISRHSLVPTNPISAIKQPQVTRQGSSHSSKLRIYGTSPRYYINGMGIGYDPNHYGMFSIIPASAISELIFHAQGTGAEFALPAAIELNTPPRFKKEFDGEINISSVEATGLISIGTDNYFLSASVRKSVLDKLVDRLNISTDRMTIPPTNFQDIFVSSGLRLSSAVRLLVDHYQVRDFLSYTTGSTINNTGGVDTYQHTRESFISARLEAVTRRWLFRLGGAVKTSLEQYHALPNAQSSKDGMWVDLEANSRIYRLNVENRFFLGSTQLAIGGNMSYTSVRNINLSQRGWNFLPPDARSDNPYLYQEELNESYATYNGHHHELNNAGYIVFNHWRGLMEIETGLRLEYFGNLADHMELLSRNALKLHLSDNISTRLFYGTFAESPVNRILEPYQVLTYAKLSKLSPIYTRLASFQYSHGPVKIGIFRKWIKNIPVDTPDFNMVKSDGTAKAEFITMKSTGSAIFFGGDITLSIDRFILHGTDLYAYYSYSRSDKYISGLKIPYELDAAHKLFFGLDHRLSRVVLIGGELTVRSGYPYTPTRSADIYRDEDRYSYDFYIREISRENSDRFPTHAAVNLHTDFNFGNTEIFLSISNITNHDNPIINASDGYIYDAGILPTIGVKYSF